MHERTRILLGDEGLLRLGEAHVAVLGLGGVGSAAAEELVRAGVGRLTIADFDVVKESNLNRQLIALTSTLGRAKVEVMAERLRDINTSVDLTLLKDFLGPESFGELKLKRFDYVLDCIDSLNPKVALIRAAYEAGARIIVSTGAGGRIDPVGVRIENLFATKNCPLSRHLRKRLRNQGVTGPIPAVYNPNPPLARTEEWPGESETERGRPRRPIGSISFVPVVYGCVMASWVVRELLGMTDGFQSVGMSAASFSGSRRKGLPSPPKNP